MTDELGLSAEAAKIDLNGLEQRINLFAAQMKKIEAQVERMIAAGDFVVEENLGPFIKAAESQVAQVTKQVKDCKTMFNEIAMYYGETPKTLEKLTPAQWFGFVSRFGKEFQAIIRDKEDKAAREAKRLAKAKADKKVKVEAAKESKAGAKKEVAVKAVVASRREEELESGLAIKTGGLNVDGGPAAAAGSELMSKVQEIVA